MSHEETEEHVGLKRVSGRAGEREEGGQRVCERTLDCRDGNEAVISMWRASNIDTIRWNEVVLVFTRSHLRRARTSSTCSTSCSEGSSWRPPAVQWGAL